MWIWKYDGEMWYLHIQHGILFPFRTNSSLRVFWCECFTVPVNTFGGQGRYSCFVYSKGVEWALPKTIERLFLIKMTRRQR